MTEIPITLTSTFFKNTKIYKDLFMIEVIIDQYALNHQLSYSFTSLEINLGFLLVCVVELGSRWLSKTTCKELKGHTALEIEALESVTHHFP